MKTSATVLSVLGACLCFAAIPAAAQGGRGAGRAGGPPSGQAARPTPGPAQQTGSGKAHSTPGGPQAARSMAAAQSLEKSPELTSRLQSMLPAGATVSEAATGFDNLGRFVSAVHVSHNLGLPFDGLKQEMLAGSSLGQAIQKLKPDMPKQEVEREMKRAEVQAKADLKPPGATRRTRDRDREQEQIEPAKQP